MPASNGAVPLPYLLPSDIIFCISDNPWSPGVGTRDSAYLKDPKYSGGFDRPISLCDRLVEYCRMGSNIDLLQEEFVVTA